MSMVPAGNGRAGSWQVTGQTPTARPGPSGRFVDGMLVHVVTGLGNVFTVFVPETLYTLANVRTLVAQKARQVDAVGGLSTSGQG